MVMINGTVLPSATNFIIDIQCDGKTNQDVAFHFNPRFNKGNVVCNTKRKRIWGSEEHKSEVPFTLGQPFEIRTLVTRQNYKVSVDRSEFLEYNHRIPVELVTTLGVYGGVIVKTVEIQARGAAFP
ncbi:galectin-9-like [Bufo bufo]|uniref:galectin-9-like n=1 Tax=Bufo bufo TaxID=8384 RepID=UPI001ABDB534|nr:galectin-9-like [Bufo bufo]